MRCQSDSIGGSKLLEFFVADSSTAIAPQREKRTALNS